MSLKNRQNEKKELKSILSADSTQSHDGFADCLTISVHFPHQNPLLPLILKSLGYH